MQRRTSARARLRRRGTCKKGSHIALSTLAGERWAKTLSWVRLQLSCTARLSQLRTPILRDGTREFL